MRDFRDAKAMAQTLRAALAAMGFKITVSRSLELIAQAFGVADWNTLSAAIRPVAAAVPEKTARPPPTAESATAPGKPTGSLPADLLSGELVTTLNRAFAYAKGRKHDEISVEHLLLLLLDDADASRVLKASGANLDDLRERLTDFIDNHLKIYPTDGEYVPRPTLGFQRVLQRAVFHVKSTGRLPVKSLNVLVALFAEQESHAVKLFNEQGVTRVDVLDHISLGTMQGGEGPGDRPTSS